jgi:hypothetical protein
MSRISHRARSRHAARAVNSGKCGLDCGLRILLQHPVTLKRMVGLGGLEPPTSPLSGVLAGLVVSRSLSPMKLPKGLKLFAFANFGVFGN